MSLFKFEMVGGTPSSLLPLALLSFYSSHGTSTSWFCSHYATTSQRSSQPLEMDFPDLQSRTSGLLIQVTHAKESPVESKAFITSTTKECSPDSTIAEDGPVASYSFAKFFKHCCQWTLEIFGILVSVVSLGALIIVLRVYDGRPLSDWSPIAFSGYSINISLNFVISILGTLSKSLLALSVAAGISQSKWIWFRDRKRPLLDFKKFEDASRGPSGSFALLNATKLR